MTSWLPKLLCGPAPTPTPVAAPAPLVERAENLLRRLEWTVLRRLDGLLQGHHRTVMRGQGMDLADLREYQHHDDVRHIDWNLTARMDQPHVRVFTEDREMSAWFLLDLSGSVDFGSGHQRKSDLAQELVAVLAKPPQFGCAEALTLLLRSGCAHAALDESSQYRLVPLDP